ncbi:hypothetical protein [Shigella phage ESh36]|nr:hypothetical protein [Shigella phage ESh36]
MLMVINLSYHNMDNSIEFYLDLIYICHYVLDKIQDLYQCDRRNHM